MTVMILIMMMITNSMVSAKNMKEFMIIAVIQVITGGYKQYL